MTTTPEIERVAHAIETLLQDVGVIATNGRALARAALEAIREPSEAMINDGACYEHYDDLPVEYRVNNEEGEMAREIFQAMIDAALGESE